MTENEAIEGLEFFQKKLHNGIFADRTECLDVAIDALKEIGQYRALGTVDRFKQLSDQFAPHIIDDTSCPERHCNLCDKYRKENEKYHEIGTIEECRAAVEGQKIIALLKPHILNKAVDIYGAATQTDMAIEEMSELTKALLKFRRAEHNPEEYDIEKRRKDIYEEISDVIIMLVQLIMIYGGDEEIQKIIEGKVRRLEQRLKI